jgi:hypothetical protein
VRRLLSCPSPRNDLVADAPPFHVTLWDAAGPKGTFLAGAVFALIARCGLVAIRRYKLAASTQEKA